MNDLWNNSRLQEKLAQLRKKYSDAKKKNDTTMMDIIFRQAKALKIANPTYQEPLH